MKVSELIEKLKAMPQDEQVCIGDYLYNAHMADGDEAGNSDGIYPTFTIDRMTEKDIPTGSKPWVSLTFKNEIFDYYDLVSK